ncbi:hypothetical protein BJY04DRAFT_229174 [Aspergillus karnatakaensis]|uniref:uncharacterized protein n=1 Tax=Aspergillus karnatakaensis TaxID=1810916 RepID=UPI003CCCB72E
MNTTLESWRFNNDTRSSWQIVYPCLTTVFACTWTIIHLRVPRHGSCAWLTSTQKLTGWLMTLLVPEGVGYWAAVELTQARALVRRYSLAELESNRRTPEPTSWLYKRTRPLFEMEELGTAKLHPPPAKWTLSRCFAIFAGGLAIETEDGWIFHVGVDAAHKLIECGIVRSSDFNDGDIDGRAKSDWFAKGFAVLQSTWILISIIARAWCHLPITPLELSTIAYVVCGLLIYAVWWYKPQDMTLPVTVYLPCARLNLSGEVKAITDRYPQGWVHRRVIPRPLYADPVLWKVGGRNLSNKVSLKEELFILNVAGIGGLTFCGLHVIAWNFPFPTHAELVAWRVFSLTSLAIVSVFYIAAQLLFTLRVLAKTGRPLPKRLMNLVGLEQNAMSIKEHLARYLLLIIYSVARFGMVALTLSSLRALPTGCYSTLTWWESVPHI